MYIDACVFQVTLTANLIRANQTSLEIEIENSDSPPIVLPITYNAMVPIIQPAPEIKLRMCFIEYAYNYEICIKCADFWGYFTLEEPEEVGTPWFSAGSLYFVFCLLLYCVCFRNPHLK